MEFSDGSVAGVQCVGKYLILTFQYFDLINEAIQVLTQTVDLNFNLSVIIFQQGLHNDFRLLKQMLTGNGRYLGLIQEGFLGRFQQILSLFFLLNLINLPLQE